MVERKDRASCWEVATGTTISAETSSSPTVRIATVTLTRGEHRHEQVVEADLQPGDRANSGSEATAKSCGSRPRVSVRTTAASPAVYRTRRWG